MIDSSHGDDDIRQNYIIDEKYVLRINSAKVMSESRINDLNELIKRYNEFGIHAPYYIKNKNGNYIYNYKNFIVYASEYLDELIADDYINKNWNIEKELMDKRLELVSSFANKYKNKDLIDSYSMFSIFDLSPYDEIDGIDEKQVNLNDLVKKLNEVGEQSLAAAFSSKNDEIRNKLKLVYKELPHCVFQGDENFSNVCVDNKGNITGIFDFNMAGTDVCANYLANLAFMYKFYLDDDLFDNHDAEYVYSNLIQSFKDATKIIMKNYDFSNEEIEAYYLYANLILIESYVNASSYITWLSNDKYKVEISKLLDLVINCNVADLKI